MNSFANFCEARGHVQEIGKDPLASAFFQSASVQESGVWPHSFLPEASIRGDQRVLGVGTACWCARLKVSGWSEVHFAEVIDATVILAQRRTIDCRRTVRLPVGLHEIEAWFLELSQNRAWIQSSKLEEMLRRLSALEVSTS